MRGHGFRHSLLDGGGTVDAVLAVCMNCSVRSLLAFMFCGRGVSGGSKLRGFVGPSVESGQPHAPIRGVAHSWGDGRGRVSHTPPVQVWPQARSKHDPC